MADSSLMSPARSPFDYHVWLELPFPVAVKVDKRFCGHYNSSRTEISARTEISMVILSNVYKVVTGKRALLSRSRRAQEYVTYVTKDKIDDCVWQLTQREGTQYPHVEEIPAVVHTIVPVPAHVIPAENFLIGALVPQVGFISEEILPELQRIIDAYRIAAFPAMRYAIPPVSEALVDKALIYFTDREHIRIGNIHERFDATAPYVLESPAIQARFDQFLQKVSDLEAENQMASAYYLYRMRRWTEAITLASAVVDNLTRNVVFNFSLTKLRLS